MDSFKSILENNAAKVLYFAFLLLFVILILWNLRFMAMKGQENMIGVGSAILTESMLLLILSLVVGGVIGALLKIEDNLEGLDGVDRITSVSAENIGTLTIEVSQDNSTWKASTRTISNTTNGEPHMWNIVEQYFRIKYVNGFNLDPKPPHINTQSTIM